MLKSWKQGKLRHYSNYGTPNLKECSEARSAVSPILFHYFFSKNMGRDTCLHQINK